MLQDIPLNVQEGVKALLKNNGRIELVHFSFSGGGCINNGGKLTTTSGDFFLKWNEATKFPGMFEAEANGLQLLRAANVIRIPEVVGAGAEGSNQFLVLAFIEQGPPSKNFWENLGRQLASLHRLNGNFFGLDHNNYIGSLRQFNQPNPSWVNFFTEHRLNVQLKMAVDSNLIDRSLVISFEQLYSKLPSILPDERPALLHGDLWSGNLIRDERGEPCLIDPAVYYGSREADLAMTTLFGGFSIDFYLAYEETFPRLAGYAERADLYNLYPLLVHLNLFGNKYLRNVAAILRRFI